MGLLRGRYACERANINQSGAKGSWDRRTRSLDSRRALGVHSLCQSCFRFVERRGATYGLAACVTGVSSRSPTFATQSQLLNGAAPPAHQESAKAPAGHWMSPGQQTNIALDFRKFVQPNRPLSGRTVNHLPGYEAGPDNQRVIGEENTSDAGKDRDELEDLSPRDDDSASLQGGEDPPSPPPPDKHPDGLPRLPLPVFRTSR